MITRDFMIVSGFITQLASFKFVQGIRVDKKIEKGHVWKDLKSESNQIKNH